MAEQTEVGKTLACPIPIGSDYFPRSRGNSRLPCGKEKCAWWIPSAKACAIVVFASDLHQVLQMGNLLKALANPAKLKELMQRIDKIKQQRGG